VFGAGEVEIVGGETGGGERGMVVERWTLEEEESMPLGMERGGGGGDDDSIHRTVCYLDGGDEDDD
jgi:hypothetical protein